MILVLCVCSLFLRAQANKPAALILPPADWDAGTHILASLVATNSPGDHPLPQTWAGIERVTARTGCYTTNGYTTKGEVAHQADQWLEFDQFTVIAKSSPMREHRFISSKTKADYFGPAYRPSLPSDAELLEIKDTLSVSNLVGWDIFARRIKVHTATPTFHFFTLRPYDGIQTLRVTFNVSFLKGKENTVQGILIKRAVLQPRPKAQ